MKQSNLKFVNTLLDAIQIKVQSLPGFVRNVYHHNRNFTIADVKHEEVKFDKPIYLGATITELAKLHTHVQVLLQPCGATLGKKQSVAADDRH